MLNTETDRESHAQQCPEDGEDGDHGQGDTEGALLLPVLLDEVINDRVKCAA